jgi:hypothetical protein
VLVDADVTGRAIRTVASMQPYFLPYLGYFQLLSHCDVFVLLDDVQYVKRRWINRNRILVDGAPHWLTLPVQEASSQLPINGRHYRLDRVIIDKMLRRIEAAYRRAPHFAAVFPPLADMLNFADTNVAAFNANLVARLAAMLGVGTPLALSSSIVEGANLAGQDRIIEICRRLDATDYLNPIGGAGLYQADRFAEAGLGLRFLRPTIEPYRQFCPATVPDLSVVDALMFNDAAELGRLLQSCRIETAGESPSGPESGQPG